MNALLVLFAGGLSAEALEPLAGGKNSLALALERAGNFPGVAAALLLGREGEEYPSPAGVRVEKRPAWSRRSLLEAIASHSAGFDLSYFAWADCPFLDPELAGRLAERHLRYAAEYSYADGWPYGLAPELLSPGTAGVLAKILGDDDGPVERDTLFSVIQKDINSFDIETEISAEDLRCHRLSLCADSRRNLLLLRRFAAGTVKDAGGGADLPDTAAVERIIAENPAILRTLPNFYPVQVCGGCPQSCALCPYPASCREAGEAVTVRRDYMELALFESLLDRISAFSGDAVIDLSLWGELALHPQKMDLIAAVLRRPELALLVETSGLGWRAGELERSAELARDAAALPGRKSPLPPLSWIVSLDAADAGRYKEVRGAGFAEASGCAQKLLALFPRDAYVQAVRTAGAEDDIEQFYRSWKEAAPSGGANIIIQKYDDFCGALERRQASDLSPVSRRPCWHRMRDMPVLLDGTVPFCREDLGALKGRKDGALGNVWNDSLESIWERGQRFYIEQCEKKYGGICAGCDEYYTYNF
ncbi:MAG: spiro-SPASM protein [Treponema sp.]|jgi:spiro-SPASM protein|nr:spiro-SPASM protein [Treponema sp.]